jgi:sialic acid synthase SpsE
MKFIAEIGWNFMGDMDLAHRMIRAAKEAGADYAKFQVWNPDNLKSGPWDKDGRREIYSKAFLDDSRIKQLHDLCVQEGIGFFVSVFEKQSMDRVASFSNEIIKIPSHECVNWSLIDSAIDKFDTVFLSIGALTEDQLATLIDKYQSTKNLIVMHCVSAYPLNIENVNMPKMNFLKEKFSCVGYSSHFTGTVDAVLACALGAEYVEKHFTIDNSLPGRDNKFALLPDAFEDMIKEARLAKGCMKDCGRGLQECEQDVSKIMRGRWSKNDI